jgi:fibronectin-binding autotransporter adhesin
MFAGELFHTPRGVAARGCGFVSAFAGVTGVERKSARLAIVRLVVGLIVAVAAQAAFSQTYLWTNGSNDGTWENSANWNPTGPTWNSLTTNTASFNSAGATVTLNAADDALAVTFGAGAAGTTIAANPGGSLSMGTAGGINASALTSGTVAITAPVTQPLNNVSHWTGATSGGTLVFAGPITINGGASAGLYFNSGNFQIATGATLANVSDFLIFNDSSTPGNFVQTGGSVYCGRTTETGGNSDIYLSQGAGGGNYTISGGTLSTKTGGSYVITVGYQNVSGPSSLNITGNGVVMTPYLALNCSTIANTIGSTTVNMQGGLLLANQVYTNTSSTGGFNFSGGTIQPLDSGSAVNSPGGTGDYIGRPNPIRNITVQITGNGATYDTTDLSGNPQSTNIYAIVTGSGSLNVIGSGTLVFASTQTGYNYSGQVNINSGTVRLTNPNPSANPSPLFTAGNANVNGGTLDVFGTAATAGTATLASGLITDSVGNGSLTAANFALQSGTVSAVLAGPSATLTKTTAGLVNLTSANTNGGATTISAGTLALANGTGNLGTGNVTITPGAVIDTSSYGSPGPTLFTTAGIFSAGRTSSPATDINGSVTLQNATISLPSAGTLTVAGNLTFGNGSNGNDTYLYAPGDLINLTAGGAVAFSTTTSILPTGPLSSGTYTLFNYGGLDPSSTADLQMASSFQSGTRQTYAFSATNGAVTLTVSGAGAANLQWNTAGSGNWDVDTTRSWYNLGTSASDFFFNADSVTFNDRPGGGSVNVSVTGTVLPGSITVSNTNVAYTFSGSGAINGSALLTKSGPGTLTISTSNGYTGGTTLSAGLLNLGNASALGTGALNINGGTLDNTSGGPLTLANNNLQNWNSGFTFKGTAPLNTGSGAVTLGTAATVNVSGSTLTVGGQISGPYGLGLSGAGWLNLSSTNAYTGDTTVSSGVLQAGIMNPLPFGAGIGNLVFNGNVQPAVLDLNGNNVAINGLSQPTVTSQSKVVNNSPSSQAVLNVGNNSNVTTFGGVLADNSNGLGGTLALTVSGGALTLTNTNTYSGTTTIGNGVTLALGTGAAGQDGQLTNTSDIVNNGTLVVNNAGPTTLAPINISTSLKGVLVQNSASTLTLTGQNYLSSLVVNTTGISGGTINLPGGNSFTNASSTEWTLSSAVNFGGAATWNGGSGTTDIEGPVTDDSGALTFISTSHGTATVVVGNLGAISVSGNALVLDNFAAGFTTTNLLQTGGSISLNRPGNYGMYFAQSNGVAFYTMTGGTISATLGTQVTLANGVSTQGYFTINGPQALAMIPSLSLDTGASGIGFVTLENGTLAADNISTMTSLGGNPAGFSGFNFSGGTLQPYGNSAQWGTSSEAFNFYLSGTGATISSNDLSGNAQTVFVYANLSGTGAITFTGSGTTILYGGNSVEGAYPAHTGASFVTGGGTLQLANPSELGSGPLTIRGAAVDLDGVSSTVGALTGDPFALITNSGYFSGGTLTVNPSSGEITTYAGTIADGPNYGGTVGLTLAGSGTLYLTGTNTYSGGTIVTGNAELIVANSEGLADGSSLTVGDASAFGGIEPASAGSRPSATLVPEPGTLALAAAAAIFLLLRRRPR